MRPKGDDWNNIGRRPIGDDTYKSSEISIGHMDIEEKIFKGFPYINLCK